MRLGATRLRINLVWFVVAAGVVAVLALFALPLYAPGLDVAGRWLAAVLTIIWLVLSLVLHVLAHILVAMRLGAPLPAQIDLGSLGDAAQIWPPHTLRADAAGALAGPLTHGLLAGLAFMIWDAQPHPIVSAVAFGVLIANTLLALVLLAPGYPCDGGRIVRHTLGARATLRLGRGAALLFAGYGLLLIGLGATGARFGIEVGVGILLAAVLVLTRQRSQPVGADPPLRRWLLPLLGVLALPPLALTPLLNGLYAPGDAVPVGPMIQSPSPRVFPSVGDLLLTTVLLQTPITAAQWIQSQTMPGYTLVPPEQIIPRDTTPEEVVRRSVSLLDASEATAIVLGAQLAGYPASITSTAVLIVDTAPESPARAVLRAGDRLVAVDGVPVRSVAALGTVLRTRAAGEQVTLDLIRDATPQQVEVTLLPPAVAGGAPRIGIAAEDDGLVIDLPFPLAITTEKIVGGPSAGLMFTLAVYDALTPADLTRGRRIAGTGTIDRDGRVGPIGGIAQKVVAAERAGATIFLTPPDHYDEAVRTARTIVVVQVTSAQEAIARLEQP